MNSKIKNTPWALLALALAVPATGFAANDKSSNQPNGTPFTGSGTDTHYPNGKPFSGDADNTNYLNGRPFVEAVVEEEVVAEPVVEEEVTAEPVVEEEVTAEPVVEEEVTAEPVVEVTLVKGVQRNVSTSELEAGWEQCIGTGTEGAITYDKIPDWNDIVNNLCTKNKLMLACRETGSNILQVAAQGLHSDVTKDTGDNAYDTHVANGVAWYFSEARGSWGFAEADAGVYKMLCDRVSGESRLCWHLFDAGYRCGDSMPLDGAEYERVIYQAD